MSLWAVVPIKPLRRGKSRLSSKYSEEERMILNREMLRHTIERLQQVKGLEKILVVSRDPEALTVARKMGAQTLLESGNPGLNVALTRASLLAKAYKVRGVLVIPADLPLLEPEDVQEMISMVNGKPAVVIAPDRHHEGTNAMLVAPPDLIKFDYGKGSFERHRDQALRAGADLRIVEKESFSLDLDWPEDLDAVGDRLPYFDEDELTESWVPF
ncbi:MAG: 2-phospho-L-lactate guanylyltransferase [Anaerolineales bacterium]|nr:2-phospho-L-lactate guanylyltransferase [Anaerolineales bacterium]